jgi:uncharacterized peroxidase-related enzyme
MRLPEIERGDTWRTRLLIRMISTVSGMRLPDAARVALYHRSFFGCTFGTWTQAAMRGDSQWSIGERELMAALVAKWNNCPFCVGAHGAVAARAMDRATTDAAIADYRSAGLSAELVATLTFLEKLTVTPADVTGTDASAVLATGVTREALQDAIAVASVFAVITRYANALAFAIPSTGEFDTAAGMLLKRGYGRSP